MAQTAAQRKAAEEKAKQEQEAANAAASAQQATPDEEDEFASTPASSDDTGASDAEKLAEAEAALRAAEDERNKAVNDRDRLLAGVADALGLPEDADGTIDDLVALVEAKITAEASQQPAPSTNESGPQAAAIRLTVEEVDGAGKALRRFGVLVPMAQANPTSVASTVQRTVEQIISIPLDAAPALQQEPVED